MNTVAALPRREQSSQVTTRKWVVSGIVQGVGFRPFIYRLASAYGLDGWVKNRVGQVEIVATGNPSRLDAFGSDVLEKAPQISRPRINHVQTLLHDMAGGFAILPSDGGCASDIHLVVDNITPDTVQGF